MRQFVYVDRDPAGVEFYANPDEQNTERMEVVRNDDGTITLKSCAYLTRQEIFAGAVLGLMQQGCLSKNVHESYGPACRYRGAEDTKCGIGFLIPDSAYSEWLEGATANMTSIQEAANINPSDADFAAQVQKLHDGLAGEPEELFIPMLYAQAKLFANMNADIWLTVEIEAEWGKWSENYCHAQAEAAEWIEPPLD